jgi:hypothetical protein
VVKLKWQLHAEDMKSQHRGCRQWNKHVHHLGRHLHRFCLPQYMNMTHH